MDQAINPQVAHDKSHFHITAEEADHNRRAEILSQGGCTSHLSSCDWTALHAAVDRGHLECVKSLLSNGSDIECRDKEGWTPLHLAAYHGHLDIAKTLIAYGADIFAENMTKKVPLDLSTCMEVRKYIYHIMSEIEELQRASSSGDLSLIRAILSRKELSPNTHFSDSNTPMHLCAGGGHVECLREIRLLGGDVNSRGDYGRAPLHFASSGGFLPCITELLDSDAVLFPKDICAWTPLHDAAFYGHADCMLEIINRVGGHNGWKGLDMENDDGNTPLHCAAMGGHVKCVRVALSSGGDCTRKNQSGFSSIHLAVLNGERECVMEMVCKGEMTVSHAAVLELINVSIEVASKKNMEDK